MSNFSIPNVTLSIFGRFCLPCAENKVFLSCSAYIFLNFVCGSNITIVSCNSEHNLKGKSVKNYIRGSLNMKRRAKQSKLLLLTFFSVAPNRKNNLMLLGLISFDILIHYNHMAVLDILSHSICCEISHLRTYAKCSLNGKLTVSTKMKTESICSRMSHKTSVITASLGRKTSGCSKFLVLHGSHFSAT